MKSATPKTELPPSIQLRKLVFGGALNFARRFCRHPLSFALVAAMAVTLAGGAPAEPEVDLKELPRLPAVEPTNTLATFKIKPGFHLELVAAEPLVRDPIEICFDENGRMFVVEMVDYSEMRDLKPHGGRISMLQ